nr:MAG TPA: hypothetical protein [Caudoviricetes sp.]
MYGKQAGSPQPSFEKGSPRQGSCFAAPPSGGLQG